MFTWWFLQAVGVVWVHFYSPDLTEFVLEFPHHMRELQLSDFSAREENCESEPRLDVMRPQSCKIINSAITEAKISCSINSSSAFKFSSPVRIMPIMVQKQQGRVMSLLVEIYWTSPEHSLKDKEGKKTTVHEHGWAVVILETTYVTCFSDIECSYLTTALSRMLQSEGITPVSSLKATDEILRKLDRNGGKVVTHTEDRR